MVVKTEICSFSEYRIYPGHGMKFVRRDGQPVLLSSSKTKRLLNNRKKPAKLMWTQAWRRLNKKLRDDGAVKRKIRKTVKVQRAIVGASLEEIQKKKATVKPKNVATEAALKEVKERSKTTGIKKLSATRVQQPNVPKNQKVPVAKVGARR